MDNMNVIRVGFFAPEFRIPDTDGEIDDPIDRMGRKFTCLAFINPDDEGAGLIKALEQDLPGTAGGCELVISAIAPVKLKQAKAFKDKAGFRTRLFCDSDMRVGQLFSVVDSSNPRPSYHSIVFVIGDDYSIRYRQAVEASGFDIKRFQTSVSELV